MNSNTAEILKSTLVAIGFDFRISARVVRRFIARCLAREWFGESRRENRWEMTDTTTGSWGWERGGETGICR
nr:hypothetical protein Itr_chr08CG21310 [Ipomoea trifida]